MLLPFATEPLSIVMPTQCVMKKTSSQRFLCLLSLFRKSLHLHGIFAVAEDPVQKTAPVLLDLNLAPSSATTLVVISSEMLVS